MTILVDPSAIAEFFDLKSDPSGVLRGFSGPFMGEEIGRFLEGWTLRGDWCDGWHRRVWVHRDERAILTYCEGDLSLTVDEDEAALDRRIAEAAAFYTDH